MDSLKSTLPLERATERGLLWVVPERSSSPVAAVGSVAVAATSGALIAIGHRLGSAALPFAAVGAALLRGPASATDTRVVFAGVVVHVVTVLVWTLICVEIARVFALGAFAGVVVAASQFILSYFVARSTGGGLASALALGDRIVYAVVLAGALVVGMRFAFVRGVTSVHAQRNANDVM